MKRRLGQDKTFLGGDGWNSNEVEDLLRTFAYILTLLISAAEHSVFFNLA